MQGNNVGGCRIFEASANAQVDLQPGQGHVTGFYDTRQGHLTSVGLILPYCSVLRQPTRSDLKEWVQGKIAHGFPRTKASWSRWGPRLRLAWLEGQHFLAQGSEEATSRQQRDVGVHDIAVRMSSFAVYTDHGLIQHSTTPSTQDSHPIVNWRHENLMRLHLGLVGFRFCRIGTPKPMGTERKPCLAVFDKNIAARTAFDRCARVCKAS